MTRVDSRHGSSIETSKESCDASSDSPVTAYIIKISLLGTEPSIWRRFCVPGGITLDRLHDVIQIVMGWQECHLHCFEIDGQRYTESPEDPEVDGQDEAGFKLSDLVSRAKTKFAYEYDFGDGWRHELAVESIDQVPKGHRPCIGCMDGKRCCPPEDVGGIDGYVEFLAALLDPKHPEHDSSREWCENGFDPKAYDLEWTNFELRKYARWSRSRHMDQPLAGGS